MIIKKPYAFLIQNFRKIHGILSAILIIIFYNSLTTFSTIMQLVNKELNRTYAINSINYFTIILIILSLVAFMFMFILMKHKQKPKLIYILSFLAYIAVMVLFIFIFSYFNTLQEELLSEKIIRLYRDFFIIALLVEAIITILMIVRACGFDIKKFDFNKDLQELNIIASDSEEIEVNVNVNTNKIIGFLNGKRRDLVYYVKENKLIFSVIAIIIIIVLIIKIPKLITGNTSRYKLNETYTFNGYELTVNNSYITNLDYNNNVINNDYFVIVSFNIKDLTSSKREIDPSSFILKIGRKQYYPALKYCNNFNDIGGCYTGGRVSTKESYNYIMVYDIPSKYKKRGKSFLYKYAGYDNEIYTSKVKLKNNYIFEKNDVKEYKLNSKIEFNDGLINNNYFLIKSYEIANSFDYSDANENNYNIESNADTLIKLEIDTNIENITSSDLFKYYSKLYYIVDGQEESTSVIFKKSYNSNLIFIEVDDDIKNASSIWFDFNVRNNEYKYIIK